MREGEGVAPSRPCAPRGAGVGTCRTRVPFPRRGASRATPPEEYPAAPPSGPRPPPPPAPRLSWEPFRDDAIPTRERALSPPRKPRPRATTPREVRSEIPPTRVTRRARPTQRPRGSKSRWEGSRFDFTPAGFLVQNDISHIVITAAKGITPFPLASREPSALFEALRVGDAARASILRDTPRGGRQRAARGPAARVVPHRDVRGRRRECRVVDAQPLDA